MKYRVLIVDDEALLVRTLSQAFRDAGYDVVTAGSAEDAKEILDSTEAFDLLLLDNRLPGKSGLELLGEVGKMPETRIVLMTAYDTDETYKESIRLGADLYLSKPFDLKALLSKASELVAKGAGA
ncbi:response regulator [Candidatus Eisenbacteria bacterium]|uniref:Response regulator n=1 Tax=Eiseniibacteriota bacterium TaxID=2212470 RepID=A0ABV6YM01_UNCEI